MSDTDSFIEEVSEEVRRDRLFRLFKKYGWIAIVFVVLIVVGAAFNEYRKITNQKSAALLGDGLYEALQSENAARLTMLDIIEPKKIDARAVVELIKANTLIEIGNIEEAVILFEGISRNLDYSPHYRELADFKSILLSDNTLQQRYDNLQSYTQPGSTLRIIAMEEISLIQIQLGKFKDAVKTLEGMLQEPEINGGQAKRATDLLRILSDPKGADTSE